MKTGMNRYSSASADQTPERQVTQAVARGTPTAGRGRFDLRRGGRVDDGHQIAASVRFWAPSRRA